MKTFLLPLMLLLGCQAFAQNNGINFMKQNNNYILTPNHSDINVQNNFTIEFWIRPNKNQTVATILQEGKCGGSAFSYHVSIQTDSTLIFAFNCNGSCSYTNGYTCNTNIYSGACIHVAICYSSAGVQFYFNGVLQPGQYTTGSYCGNLYNSSEQLRIASYKSINETISSYYDGLLDDLRIWGRVLTSNEILANYQNRLNGNESDLRLYYIFDNTQNGMGMNVINYATATGSALDGLTYSTNSSSPYTDNPCFIYTGFNENLLYSANFSVYPNPSTGKVTVLGKNIKAIELWNILGENIYTIRPELSNEIDFSNFQNGIYFIKIYSEEKMHIEKIVKQ